MHALIGFTNYLHESADESRHNANLSFSIAILGTVLLVGGILLTISTASNPQWILFFPYDLTNDPHSLLGMAMTVIGLGLMIMGIGLAIHYSSQRLWYLDELKLTFRAEENKLKSMRKTKVIKRKKTK